MEIHNLLSSSSCILGSAETVVRGGGITNHHLIAYSLYLSGTFCQKLPKSVDVIECNISVVFWDTVYLRFYYRATACNATHGIAVAILSVRPSVCPSVCPSVRPSVRQMRLLWQNQTTHCECVDTTRNGNQSSFLTPTVVGGWCPLPSEICSQSDPPPA